MKITIIGAGIGGLTTAIALKNAGIDYEIFEASPELKPVGAGIVMASNAMQIFQRLGIAPLIISNGFEISSASNVDENFKSIVTLSLKEKVTPRYGIGSYAIHRWALQNALLSQLDMSKIHLNKRLTGLSQSDNTVSLSFDDGTHTSANLVIGADGIKSVVRKFIAGDIPLRYSGQTCWRGVSSFQLPEPLRSNSYEMWGNQKGLRFGFVPISNKEIYFFNTLFTEPNGKDEPGTTKSKLKSINSVFGKTILSLIEATPEHSIIRSDINDFVPISKWWQGNVVLMGDAAHATTPNLGQGGCQAVEDAFVLVQMLKEKKSAEEAFKNYQQVRIEKATYIVNMSWKFGQVTNLDSGIMRWIRNTAMRMMPESLSIKQLDKILRIDY